MKATYCIVTSIIINFDDYIVFFLRLLGKYATITINRCSLSREKRGGQVSSRLVPHSCINLKQILLFRLEVVNERELEVLTAQIKTEVCACFSAINIFLVACVAQPSNLCEESEVLCNVDRNTWTNTNVP